MFLCERDFHRLLNESDISILLNSTILLDSEILLEAQSFAIEYVKTKIQQRYDASKVFINVDMFAFGTNYVINDQVYYTENAHSDISNYASGDRVSFDKVIYQAKKITVGAFIIDDWDEVCPDLALFYCIADCVNVTPDNSLYFRKGDLRNPLIKDYCIKKTIFELFIRVNPRVIPDYIISNEDMLTKHLNLISSGKDTLLLPTYEDEEKGQNITYNSQTQQDWTW